MASDDLLLQLRALGEAEFFSAGLDEEQLLSALLTHARKVLRCEAGYLYRERGGKLELAVAQDDRVGPMALARYRPEPTPLDATALVARVATTGQPLAAADAYALDGDVRFDAGLDATLGTKTKALLVVPVLGRARRPLAVLQLLHGAPFAEGALDLSRALAHQAGLALDGARERARLFDQALVMVCQLGCAGEYEDADARWHVRRISAYAALLAREQGLDAELVEQVRFASPLHDLGKIAIPPSILYKPGKLTSEEFALTQRHCELGWRMLKETDAPVMQMAGEIAHAHHERWDGSGYPRGLKGEAIPLPARITALVDVFDALSTKRSYKPALGLDQSLKILRQEAGKHFDPALVEAFQRCFTELLEVKRAFTPDESTPAPGA